MRVGTRVRVPLHGRTRPGLGRGGRRRCLRRRRSPAPQVVARLGAATARDGAGGVGVLALGRADVVLPAGRVPSHGRAGAARTARRRSRRRRARLAASEEASAPAWMGACARGARRDGGAPASPHRPHRARALRRRGCRRPRPRREHRRPGPVHRVGGAAPGPARAPRLRGHRAHGTRRGRDGRSWSGAGPARGHPCRVLRPRSCSTPMTRRTGRRARRPTARSTWSWSGPVGRAPRASSSRRFRPSRWRHAPACGRSLLRLTRSGPAGRRSSGWTGAAPTRAAGCSRRSSCAWPGSCSTIPRRWRRGTLSSASTTARAAHACWRAGTAGSWPAARGAAPRRPDRATRRGCTARVAATSGRSCAWRAAGCA